MVTRSAPVLFALILAWTGACSVADKEHPAPELAVGDPAPALLSTSAAAEVLQVTWVFGPADPLSCRNSARELRRLAGMRDSGIVLRAVAVDLDTAYVRSFFRAERLSIPVIHVSRDRLPPDVHWPAVYVMRDGRVRAVFPGSPRTDDAERERQMEAVVRDLAGATPPGAGPDQPPVD